MYKPGILSVSLRTKLLAYLCESPILVPLPEAFFDEDWTEVNLGGCVIPNGILAQIGREIQTLETLDLKQCSGHELLDHKSFAALCDGCRQLRKIDLVGVMTFSDVHLGYMHKLGSSLRTVRLGGCICLSPAAIALFIQRAGLNLYELDLSGCQVNDDVIKAIIMHCKNLHVLSLSYCDDASHWALALLIRRLKKVVHFRLTRVTVVSKALILLIASHMGSNLISLDLAGCKDIHDDELVYLAQCCTNLKSLKLKYCKNLTMELLDTHLPEMLPDCMVDRDRPRFDQDNRD
eukprot:CAMPEP_0181301656 /NCGR_PEP_ID=MMETSP1101-20121128/7543_1 /TAXON_ID=46948 /ORGANISM="Rhodomonas abbreviata, Strain Caron Lab Isolate" /LENGTH=290 /DNA_ID=CAMNT_0023406981 /DNA_START=227 /DNA_END=1099 /DNA_ORIENTATION=+